MIMSTTPPKSSPATSTLARASLRMKAISGGARRQLTGASVTRALMQPNQSTKKSSMFFASTPTRSPGLRPSASSAWAHWFEARSRSPNVVTRPSNQMASASGRSRA